MFRESETVWTATAQGPTVGFHDNYNETSAFISVIKLYE